MKEPRMIPRRVQRLAINHLLLELARLFHNKAYKGAGGRPFGSEIDTVFVGVCAAIGDLEERPMNASDIAAYIEMPRATVQRKLDQLVKREILVRVGTRYRMSPASVANGERFVELADKAIARVKAFPD